MSDRQDAPTPWGTDTGHVSAHRVQLSTIAPSILRQEAQHILACNAAAEFQIQEN
jgi:hypothetical protein